MNSFELLVKCACRPGSKLLTLSFDILERIDKQFKIGKKNNNIKQRWQLLYYQEQQYVDMPELIDHIMVYNINYNYINYDYYNNYIILNN